MQVSDQLVPHENVTLVSTLKLISLLYYLKSPVVGANNCYSFKFLNFDVQNTLDALDESLRLFIAKTLLDSSYGFHSWTHPLNVYIKQESMSCPCVCKVEWISHINLPLCVVRLCVGWSLICITCKAFIPICQS
jgi:hypothetical protein